MNVSDDKLQAVIRSVIDRGIESGRIASGRAASGAAAASGAVVHASHLLLVLPARPDSDGTCVIEPGVACVHCGFCQSFGH
jgi:hypothetical protein